MEIWKDIPGFEGFYQVSNLGRLRSLDRSRPVRDRSGSYTIRHDKGAYIKGSDNGNGYLSIRLTKDGKRHVLYVHRIVADAFVPRRPGCDTINHLDHNRGNNAAYNLEWTTQGDNVRYSRHLLCHPKNSRLPSTGEKYIHKYGSSFRVSIKGKCCRKFKSLDAAIAFRNEVMANA